MNRNPQYAAALIDDQALTQPPKGIKILFDFPRKFVRNLCYFRSLFLVSRELIGTHLHEGEPVLF